MKFRESEEVDEAVVEEWLGEQRAKLHLSTHEMPLARLPLRCPVPRGWGGAGRKGRGKGGVRRAVGGRGVD